MFDSENGVHYRVRLSAPSTALGVKRVPDSDLSASCGSWFRFADIGFQSVYHHALFTQEAGHRTTFTSKLQYTADAGEIKAAQTVGPLTAQVVLGGPVVDVNIEFLQVTVEIGGMPQHHPKVFLHIDGSFYQESPGFPKNIQVVFPTERVLQT